MQSRPADSYPLGAHVLSGGRCSFKVWAPNTPTLTLDLAPRVSGAPSRLVELHRHGDVFGAVVDDVVDGDRYRFVFPDGRKRPDPRSMRQPDGVHGPSAVVDPSLFGFTRGRPSLPPTREHVIYELHVGAFSRAGTFDGVVERLAYLGDLGVTAIELMPVASFPGSRNWGYDGVHLFSVQESYGGPAGLARLVQAAHDHGLAVILDVVYNHLGPEGNYLREFGPYFTHKHETPWGDAVNFDDEGSSFVRSWAIDNAIQWIRDYQIDGLRLDAVHAIRDDSQRHVLAEIAAAVQALGGFLIAESDMNDPVTILGRPDGWGFDAQWSDDLHHALHAALTGERTGYYVDFGPVGDIVDALNKGFVYDGSRPSAYRQGLLHGKSTKGIPAERHVVCIQNHDQVGNRARGDRLSDLVSLDEVKLAATVLLLSPGIPMLFMGEEYAAAQPFPYFTSHSDPDLALAVSEGRRREFEAFAWQGEVPDPQLPATFESAILDPADRSLPPHDEVFTLYRQLLQLRRTHPALRGDQRQTRTKATAQGDTLLLERWAGSGERLLLVANFGDRPAEVELPDHLTWKPLLHTAATAHSGAYGGGAGRDTLEIPAHAASIFTATS